MESHMIDNELLYQVSIILINPGGFIKVGSDKKNNNFASQLFNIIIN